MTRRFSQRLSVCTTAWRWAPFTIADGSEEQKQKEAAADGAFGKNRLLRTDRAARRFSASGGLDSRPAKLRRRHLDSQWLEKRWIGNRSVVRCFHHLGARPQQITRSIGFIVENKSTPGFTVDKIENKIAARRSSRTANINAEGRSKLPGDAESNASRGATRSATRRKCYVKMTTSTSVAWMSDKCDGGLQRLHSSIASSVCSSEGRSVIVPNGAGSFGAR